jgi:hypothetical protein
MDAAVRSSAKHQLNVQLSGHRISEHEEGGSQNESLL